MNDLRSLKQDERLEEMLEVLESMEQELAQKDIIPVAYTHPTLQTSDAV